MRRFAFVLALVFSISSSGLTAPYYRVISPPPGKDVGGKNVEISVSFNTESEDGINYIELEIDGKSIQERQLDSPRKRGICSFIWDTNSVENGKHRIGVKLYSGSRLLGSATGECRVVNRPPDLTPPIIEYFNVRPGQLVKGQIEIKLRVIDDSGEPPLVSIFVDGELRMLKNNPPYSYIWDTTLYDDGEHAVHAWAYDSAGNRTVAPEVKLFVKNQMAPLKLAQANPVPDKSTAAASTTGPAGDLQAIPPVNTPAISPTAAPPARAAEPDRAIPTLEEPVVVAAAPVSPTETPAVQVEMPALKTLAPLGTPPQVEESISRIEVPSFKNDEPLVRFIEPAYSEMAGEDTKNEARRNSAREAATAKLEATAAAENQLEMPSLGPRLAASEGLSPKKSVPQAGAEAPRIALLPADRYFQASHKTMEPAAPEAPKQRETSVKWDQSEGRIRAEMYGESFWVDASNVNGILFAPLRQVWEHTDCHSPLMWYPESQMVRGTSRMVDLEMRVGQRRAMVNGVPFDMVVAPYIQNGRTMVGLPFLQHAFRMELEYNPRTNQFALIAR